MNTVDWIVMFGTLLFIALYGVYKTRRTKNVESYIKGDNENKWWEICLSVMATQASAITFLSTPGQAYEDGMRFLQFYLGLPLAMILISVFFIPIFYRLKVYTAYEFLESRFDIKTRTLTALLFLVQRTFSTGITIYAPSIILSQLLGWNLNFTVIFIGAIVTVYILSGGTKAVMVTHKQQMLVIYIGMFTAFGFLVYYINKYVSFNQGLHLAGALGKMSIITDGFNSENKFDWSDRYNIISGIIGGLFLQLSYFGTDQSQVGRYLGGESVKQSRLGLLLNGLLKVPVQFFILLTGVLVFVFYQFYQPPVYFNEVAYQNTTNSMFADSLKLYEQRYQTASENKSYYIEEFTDQFAKDDKDGMNVATKELQTAHAETQKARADIQRTVSKANKNVEDDYDYVFMTFVINYLPAGLVGLLFAVIFCASMSSTSSALNALAATFAVDFYHRFWKKNADEKQYLDASRLFTIMFGLSAIAFALIVSLFENLIEAVNILGSLFYGTILGIFLTAFLLKNVKGNAVFIAAIITECIILYLDFSVRFSWDVPKIDIGYLWYNVIGCLLVMILSVIFQPLINKRSRITESVL